jgi:hypothetical protein
LISWYNHETVQKLRFQGILRFFDVKEEKLELIGEDGKMKKILLLLFTASTFAVSIADIVPIVDNQVVEWGTTIQSDSSINFHHTGMDFYDIGIYVGNAEEFEAYFGTSYQDFQVAPDISGDYYYPGPILIYEGYGDWYWYFGGMYGVDFHLGPQHNMYAVYNNGQFVGEIFEVPEPATSLLILGALPLLRRKNRK